MIVHTEKSTVERSGTSQEHVFTIKATASAFSILSSGLYSDKILAILRELCANAYDSHVAAGNKHLPIEVKLPSAFDSTFYVKDFGTGLSHDQVISLYSTYFDSTKQDSNEFIGAFGLGSKAPFSYTTAFNIESRYDGICHIYSCFINENQLPSIVKLSDSPMSPTDSNGMTISLSTRQDDYARFETAAKKAFMYYDPQPNVVGKPNFAPYTLTHSVEGSNWKIRHSEYYAYMKGPHIVQGFITYPIDGPAISTHGLSTAAQALIGTSIDFTVPIGQVEVAASREALSYSKQTTLNIVNIFEQAATEIYDSFQAEFNKCTSRWEVGLLYEELKTAHSTEFGELFEKLHKTQPFTWIGEPVSDKLRLDVSNISHTKLIQFCVTNGGSRLSTMRDWSPYRGLDYWDIPISKKVYVVIDPTYVATRDVCRRYINSLQKKDIKLVVIKPTSKKDKNQEEIDYILESIGVSEYVLASDLIDCVDIKPRSVSNKREKTERLLWSSIETGRYSYNDTKIGKKFWEIGTVDISAGGFYIPVSRYTPFYNNSSCPTFSDIVKFSISIGILNGNTPIYGLPLAEVDKLPLDTPWINIVDHIKSTFDTYLVDNKETVYASLHGSELRNKFSYSTLDTLLCYYGKFISEVADGEFKTWWENLVYTTNLSSSFNSDHITKLANLCKCELPKPNGESLYDEWVQLTTKYTMLYFVDNAGLRTEDEVKQLIQYINVMDNPSIDI